MYIYIYIHMYMYIYIYIYIHIFNVKWYSAWCTISNQGRSKTSLAPSQETPFGQFSNFRFTESDIEGLKSQSHCLWQPQVALWKFKSPQGLGTCFYILQRGVQWKQGVMNYMMLYTILLYNTTPIYCTPLSLHPPLLSIQCFRMSFWKLTIRSECPVAIPIGIPKGVSKLLYVAYKSYVAMLALYV